MTYDEVKILSYEASSKRCLYRTTLINLGKYKLVMFAMAKLMDMDTTDLDRRVNTDFYQICEQRYQEEKRSRKNNGIISKLKSVLER